MTIPSSGPVTFTDIQTEFGGTNPIALNEYYAGGGLVPAGTTGTYGAVPSSGQISVQNFYGTTAFTPVYIEEVFQTWLYNGTGSAQTITNGINLSGSGGLVWQKDRSQGTGYHHILQDTARGATNCLFSNLANAQSQDGAGTGFVFNNNGFTIGTSNVKVNASGDNYVSWTFRKQPKFFDIVTYTGNGSSQTIAHSLGSTPGSIFVKRTDASANWIVYHRGLSSPNSIHLKLNSNAGQDGNNGMVNGTSSTTFSVGGDPPVNASGGTYVAYLFAHNAGGFGATGSDNVISCGSYTGNGSATGPEVTLGYEPQWVMIKNAINTSGSSNWVMYDNMRGLNVTPSGGGADRELYANGDFQEFSASTIKPLSTGFQLTNAGGSTNYSGDTYIYIAIRRGPMKIPTSGATVFFPSTASTGTQIPTGFNPDLWIGGSTSGDGGSSAQITMDRVRGANYLGTSSTAEALGTNNPFTDGPSNTFTNNVQGGTRAEWLFGRAPGFMDVVCYTGTGAGQVVNHNLGVVPELMIFKRRSTSGTNWVVTNAYGGVMYLDLTSGQDSSTPWDFNNTAPTATQFTTRAGSNGAVNLSGSTYVTYLFASCPGVSKIAIVNHVEPTTVVCGFVPRYIWIKSTQNTGTNDWFVFNSASGITASNDPYMRLNASAAQNTPYGAADLVDLTGNGFIMNGFGGGNYLFLAIA